MMIDMPLKQARSAVRWGRRKMIDLRLAGHVRDANAFLVSYPKSGRTWLRYLLSIYLAEIYDVPIKVDLETTFRILPNFDLDPDRGLPAFIKSGVRLELPLIAVSHRTYDQRFFAHKPVIILVRDPRDVCVSAYFHQTRHKKRFSGTIEEFIADEQFGIKSIIDYHNGWAAGLAHGPALIVSYEELSHDTDATVRSILTFLNIPIDDGCLQNAIAGAAFDRMKQDERTTRIPGHSYDPNEADSGRVRKGKVGAFGELLSDTDLDRISEMMRNQLSPAASSLMASSSYVA